MAPVEFQSPVIDSVPKVNHEIAVGEDLEFQRKWWAFERLVWVFFGLVLLLTLLGVFGRGWLAKTQKSSADGELSLKYDRIQRTGTPSDLTIEFGADAIRNDEINLYVSESLISKLGALRISPQPEKSILGDGGVTYTFPAHGYPASVVFSLQPSGPGSFTFRTSLPARGSSVQAKVVVVP
ncbi:MAG TPA: hypothetical protein VGL00_12540 [Terracidiphilus sp.]